MEIMAKVSKGTLMDQIYIPKNRIGIQIGDYVIITPVSSSEILKPETKLNFYNTKSLETIKIEIINKIFNLLNKKLSNYENLIITGSFLQEGFNFNDIDIIILSEDKIKPSIVKELLKTQFGLNTHILILNNKELLIGLNTDPLYQLMLSKCVSAKKIIYKIRNEINYKILDIHLLNSASLVNAYSLLSGREKYNMVRNAMAIKLFLENKKITLELLDKEIEKEMNIKSEEIKNNIISSEFYQKFKTFYNKLQAKIFQGIKNESK